MVRIQSECGKIHTRKTPTTDTFHAVILARKYFSINRCMANVPILHPLKTPENKRFSGDFRGNKIGTLVKKWVNTTKTTI